MKRCWREREGGKEGGIKKGGRVQKRHNIKFTLYVLETVHLSVVVSVSSIQRASVPPPPKPRLRDVVRLQ